MPRKVLFIRHGETDANHKRIHQGPDEPLNVRGREQARVVGEWLKTQDIETLASSPFVRARETAEIIGHELGLPFETLHSVVEFCRPNALYGRSHFSLPSLLYILELWLHQTDPNWDYDGAENLFHVRSRIEDAKREVAALSGNTIAIVTHAIFMDMFTEMICADRPLKVSEFIHGLLLAKKTPNTGIIEFAVDELAPNGTCRWWLKGMFSNTGKLLQ